MVLYFILKIHTLHPNKVTPTVDERYRLLVIIKGVGQRGIPLPT